ncbi:unnamed protein product [Meloidogyne enterolobii]|uniref:Uncharacterized protein n=1 Tax=Meloidogyne enterolobii TaxID=390850 RepID=A0ACB0XSW0_MELEN
MIVFVWCLQKIHLINHNIVQLILYIILKLSGYLKNSRRGVHLGFLLVFEIVQQKSIQFIMYLHLRIEFFITNIRTSLIDFQQFSIITIFLVVD